MADHEHTITENRSFWQRHKDRILTSAIVGGGSVGMVAYMIYHYAPPPQ